MLWNSSPLMQPVKGSLRNSNYYGKHRPLRTFARKFSTRQIFLKFLLQSDNELLLSEMQKIGGHRLRFRYKACGKLP